MTRMSSLQKEPCLLKVWKGSKNIYRIRTLTSLLLMYTLLSIVALMAATPSKHLSINMEETRPLLEAQVTLALQIVHIDLVASVYVSDSPLEIHIPRSFSLTSAQFDSSQI